MEGHPVERSQAILKQQKQESTSLKSRTWRWCKSPQASRIWWEAHWHYKSSTGSSQMLSHVSVSSCRLAPRLRCRVGSTLSPFLSKPMMKYLNAVALLRPAWRQSSRNALIPNDTLFISTAGQDSNTCLGWNLINGWGFQICLELRGAEGPTEDQHAGHQKSLSLPGLGALCPK